MARHNLNVNPNLRILRTWPVFYISCIQLRFFFFIFILFVRECSIICTCESCVSLKDNTKSIVEKISQNPPNPQQKKTPSQKMQPPPPKEKTAPSIFFLLMFVTSGARKLLEVLCPYSFRMWDEFTLLYLCPFCFLAHEHCSNWVEYQPYYKSKQILANSPSKHIVHL